MLLREYLPYWNCLKEQMMEKMTSLVESLKSNINDELLEITEPKFLTDQQDFSVSAKIVLGGGITILDFGIMLCAADIDSDFNGCSIKTKIKGHGDSFDFDTVQLLGNFKTHTTDIKKLKTLADRISVSQLMNIILNECLTNPAMLESVKECSSPRLNPEVVEEAQLAFWAVVAKNYPLCISGDLEPGVSFQFDNVSRSAIDVWLKSNSPSTCVSLWATNKLLKLKR